MICPHCLKTIDDGETFCPHCHGYVGGSSSSDFVFCEGCGARLSVHDRTCPKCGRPAPGILSTESSSSDLAAGKTASFPRLTKNLIQTEVPGAEPVSVARALDDSVDPSETNVLNRSDLEEAQGKRRAKKARPADEDPYHPHKRSYKGLIITLVVLALIGGAAVFIIKDPLGVMPGFYQAFQQAASETFPSRQVGENGELPTDTVGDAASDDASEQRTLTDEEVYIQLTTIYERIVSYDSAEAIGEVIDAFNGWYLDPDLSVRQQRSKSAYSLRDSIQATIDELDNLNVSETTVYTEEIDHLRQLAEWMYGRVNQICESWDVSLAIPEGESTTAQQDEILAPMRRAGNEDLENFDAYVNEWRPLPPEEAANE